MPRSPRPVRATLILMAAVVLAAIPAAVAARGVASAPRPAPRERASLPGVAVSRGPASPLNPIVSPTDTFLVAGFGFEDRLGICRTRGWTGEDRAGRIYVHPSASLVVNQSFFAGLPYTSFGAENLTGLASTTRLRTPRAVARNDSGGVIFSDEGHDRRLFEVYPASGIVRVYGIYPDGVGTHQPAAAVFDPVQHNVVASDFGGGRLLRFPGTGGVATIIAGFGTVAGDTTVAFASVGTPAEIALAPGGEVYFADPSSHRVRKLTGDGHVVTVIGTGVQGAGGNGSGAGTQLSAPSGVAP